MRANGENREDGNVRKLILGRKLIVSGLTLVVLVAALPRKSHPAPAAPSSAAKVIVNADLGHDTISRFIYGHFSEHF
jgi:hypothetical protein